MADKTEMEIDARVASCGIIRPLCFEYATPVVLVNKNNRQTRIFVAFRRLSEKVVKIRYPLHLIEVQIFVL